MQLGQLRVGYSEVIRINCSTHEFVKCSKTHSNVKRTWNWLRIIIGEQLEWCAQQQLQSQIKTTDRINSSDEVKQTAAA